ncbi:MAG: hypothetical protein HQL32_08940 [Planctomycetes bacterium]|nr:hypothetical protein [Planctomycetota bacterium]
MKFHFSGICGAGMGNVALLLAEAGHQVKGSDAQFFPPMSDQLEKMNIPILEGYGKEKITEIFTPDIQVIANALSKNHIEAEAAQKAPWISMSFPQILEEYILPERESFVVAGTHGKTTTSSLLSEMLKSKGAGAFIGGVLKNGESACKLGTGSPFVLEGDEYDTAWFDKHSKFLHYRPKFLLLTHLEWDHVDIFPTFAHMIAEFKALLDLIPENGCVYYCGDHIHLQELMDDFQGNTCSYGFKENNDLQILRSRNENNERVLECEWKSKGEKFELHTQLLGDIYYLNLVGAYGLAREYGCAHEEIQEHIAHFTGAKRRMEILKTSPYTLISDFAHHPTSIRETLTILQKEYPDKEVWAVFDPRNATSRRNTFAREITDALNLADKVTIGPIHPDARIPEEERFNALAVAQEIGPKATACLNPEELLAQFSKPIAQNSLLIIMSCGSFHGLIENHLL